MTKNCLLAVALVSLALASGCAKGGNGIVPPPIVISVTAPSGISPLAIYATQSLILTATVTNSTNTAVTWSETSTGLTCTGTPNPCGTLTPVTPATTPATATYVAPAAPSVNGLQVTITATLVSDTTKTGTLEMRILPVTVYVTPTTVVVGEGLKQQFTAVGVPDGSPQTFTWSCTATTGSCGSLVPDPNISGLAVYTATASAAAVTISATWETPPPSSVVGQAAVQVVPSRLPSGVYAFRFSGYDTSNKPVTLAGSVTVGAGGVITGGVEDVVNSGGYTQYTTVSGSYVPSAGNDNTNNLGTLTLDARASGGPKYVFTAVLNSSGIMRMIECAACVGDAGGSGSGVLQMSASNIFNAKAQTFVFGFTGVDSAGNRIGYSGLLPMTPVGNGGTIAGGLLDVNDGGNTSICGTPPCSVTGTYAAGANGLWTMSLTFGSMTLKFDFFVSGGQTKNQPDPLTLYAIHSIDTTPYQSLSGAMVYQFPLKTSTCAAPCYNNAAFKGTSVSNLTGANALVSLTLGTTDGTSSGTGGTGGFFGQFDQNNNGTILSAASFPAVSQTTNPYTYVATNGNTGRYIFNMLGDPTQTTPVPPIPFVLYASGANRGFLLDQSSSAVMTGSMDPQPPKAFYAPSEMPGTYAAATIGNSDPSTVSPVVQNLLLTSDTGQTPPAYNVAGTQNPGSITLAGTYVIQGGLGVSAPGVGTIALTNFAAPAGTSVIYAIDIDSKTSSILDFMMMGTCTPVAPATTCTTGPPSSIMFAQQ